MKYLEKFLEEKSIKDRLKNNSLEEVLNQLQDILELERDVLEKINSVKVGNIYKFGCEFVVVIYDFNDTVLVNFWHTDKFIYVNKESLIDNEILLNEKLL